jgi:hypothetical protein
MILDSSMSASPPLVLVLLIAAAACSTRPPDQASRHDVRLVTVDTLRADRVSPVRKRPNDASLSGTREREAARTPRKQLESR